MSKPVNTLAIGSFTLGALALLLIGFFIFGGGRLFNQDRIRFVVFFSSSLNGLDVGAPVKMQGVKIGEVTDIALLLNAQSGVIYKPVVIEIDRSSLSTSSQHEFQAVVSEAERIANRNRLVEIGFRARLEMQSLLTGLLYVDFDLHPEKKPVYADLNYQDILEMPSLPTTSDEIFNTAEEIAQKISSLPFEQIIYDLSDSLKEVKNLLASDQTKQTTTALTNTLNEMETTFRLVNNHLESLMQETQQTVATTRTLIATTQQELKPLLASMDQTLISTQKFIQSFDHAVGPESKLQDTLDALTAASRSVKNLTDYLERHPEALLSGKQ